MLRDLVTAGRTVAPGQFLTVRVPATSANLGPGFDSLGLALGLFDEIRVRTTDSGSTVVRVRGEGAAVLPADETHLVARTILTTLERAGFGCSGLELETDNVIPHGRGLGSSAAAIVSAVLAADALLPEQDRMGAAGLLQLCSTLEGHPDNVAPALLGSLAISWETGRAYQSTRVPVHPDIIPVVAIPTEELSTESARALLPASVSHSSASSNSGRAALLIHALSAEPRYLLDATRDFLHQDYRARAMLPSTTVMRKLRALGFASVISGAGPTVMTLAAGERQAAAAENAIRGLVQDSPDGASWRVVRLNVAVEGAKVEVHQR